MDFIKEHRIKPGNSVKLKSIDTDQSGPFKDKAEAQEFTSRNKSQDP